MTLSDILNVYTENFAIFGYRDGLYTGLINSYGLSHFEFKQLKSKLDSNFGHIRVEEITILTDDTLCIEINLRASAAEFNEMREFLKSK